MSCNEIAVSSSLSPSSFACYCAVPPISSTTICADDYLLIGFIDQPSPGLSLSSNNPFRNRAASPLPKPPPSPFDDDFNPQPQPPPSRHQSNNPFLDTTQVSYATEKLIPDLDSPTDTMAEKNNATRSATEELFVSGVPSPTFPVLSNATDCVTHAPHNHRHRLLVAQ